MTPNVVEIASLIGDASRAEMLMRLLGGKSMPASELARAAGITPQTASSHLAKMVEGGLLLQESHGRHRYYRLANQEIGHALEALCAISPSKPVRSLRESDQTKTLHFARTCYDHLAGEVGVALTERMVELGFLLENHRDFTVSSEGETWFQSFGVDTEQLRSGRRHFARQCLDWSERRHHIAGALGAAMAHRLFELLWIKRVPGGRAVSVTRKGFEAFKRELGLEWELAGSVQNIFKNDRM